MQTEYNFAPFANTITAYGPIGGTPSFTKASNAVDDYHTWVINCFAFSRGGLNIRLYNGLGFDTGITQADMRAAIVILDNTFIIPLASYVSSNPAAAYGLVAPHTMPASVYPAGEFNIPYYNQYHVSMNVADIATNNYISFYRPVTQFCLRTATQTAAFPSVTRTAAEDFSCHFFTGTPMLTFLSSLTAGSASNVVW